MDLQLNSKQLLVFRSNGKDNHPASKSASTSATLTLSAPTILWTRNMIDCIRSRLKTQQSSLKKRRSKWLGSETSPEAARLLILVTPTCIDGTKEVWSTSHIIALTDMWSVEVVTQSASMRTACIRGRREPGRMLKCSNSRVDLPLCFRSNLE